MQADYKTSVVEPTINKIIEEDITENIINDFKTAFKFTDKEFQEQIYKDFATAALRKMKEDVTEGKGSTAQDLEQATKVLELVLRQRDIVRSANTFIQGNEEAKDKAKKQEKKIEEEKGELRRLQTDILTDLRIKDESNMEKI